MAVQARRAPVEFRWKIVSFALFVSTVMLGLMVLSDEDEEGDAHEAASVEPICMTDDRWRRIGDVETEICEPGEQPGFLITAGGATYLAGVPGAGPPAGDGGGQEAFGPGLPSTPADAPDQTTSSTAAPAPGPAAESTTTTTMAGTPRAAAGAPAPIVMERVLEKTIVEKTGEPGPPGPPGPSGEPGPAGRNGISGYFVATKTFDVPPGRRPVEDSVSCPPGKVLLGGGAMPMAPGDDPLTSLFMLEFVTVVRSAPVIVDGTEPRWTASVRNDPGGGLDVVPVLLTAICADIELDEAAG